MRNETMPAKHPTEQAEAPPGTVAKLHERGDSERKPSSYHEWLKVPPISGFELVYVLQHIGFVPRPGSGGVATMQRAGDVIEVPLSDQLDTEVLIEILRRARLAPNALLALLDP
jgi:hypothetical protein